MAEDQPLEVPQGEAHADRRASLDVPFDSADPMFSSDDFRIYEMKIRRCPRARPHDWTLCPFAHPVSLIYAFLWLDLKLLHILLIFLLNVLHLLVQGEKAKRRDPRKYSYSGTACAEYRKTGQCARGDTCTFSHGVFECHLHPSRYRTQLCTDGMGCRRRVCFFAHQESELRRLPEGMTHPGSGSPTQQIPGEFPAEAALLQGQAQLAQALHNYIDIQNRVRQEEAITAAAQLLDPMAKLRLLRALQGQASVGGLGGNGGDAGVDPALLAALSGLNMGAAGGVAAPARHSIDGGYVGAGASLGSFAAPPSVPAAGRRSIDIGSLSRTALDSFTSANALNTAAKLQSFVSQDAAASSAAMGMAGVSPSMNAGPSPQLFGSLPSSNFIDYAAGMSFYRSSLTETGVSSTTSSDGPEHPTTCNASGLHSIDELGPVGDDESSSSTSVVARSVSAGSSLDASGKEAAIGAVSHRGMGINGQVPRVMSFDNILAELPRSASQVNMVELGMGYT